LAITGPVVLTAVPEFTQSAVGWSLAGPGSLSGTVGIQIVYSPPAMPGAGATATVTATVDTASASIQLTSTLPPLAPSVVPGLSAAVQVQYDAQDIPHLTCATPNDCFAAQGYLQARDRLFQMDFFRRVARGQLSSLLGPSGVTQDKSLLTVFTTRDGKRIEDALAGALDAATKAYLTAFATGVNSRLAELRADKTIPLPAEYAQVPAPLTAADIPDWTIQDTLGIARLFQFQLSDNSGQETNYGIFVQTYGLPNSPNRDQGKVNAWIRARQPVPSYTITSLKAGPPAQLQVGMDMGPWVGGLREAQAQLADVHGLLGAVGVTGSNNWAVDGKHSATGQAMVANDPHLSLQYPPNFHLIAMTATDSSGLSLQGASFPGTPAVLIGRGAHVGWGDTVVGYDVTDLYLESLTNDNCPTAAAGLPCVRFKGASVPMAVVPLTIQIRTPSGLVPSNTTVLVVPHHGPIVSFDPAHGSAVSMRWTGQEVTNDVKAFLNLALATSVGDINRAPGTAFAALHDFAVGAQNFVIADDKGNIGYDPHALVPKRPWAGTAPNGVPLLPWLPLPGTGSAEWGSQDPADACDGTLTGGTLPSANCWVPDEQLPWQVNPSKGYLATANSDPRGDSDDNNPIVNPNGTPYLSFDWDDPTGVRHSRIVDQLAAKTANNGKVALTDMEAIQSDHVSKLAIVMQPFLAAAATGAPPQYAASMSMFNTWASDGYDCPTGLTGIDPKSPADTDPVHNRDSAACLLFHTFFRTLINNVFADDLRVAKLPIDGGPAIRAMVYMLTQGTPVEDTTFCNDVNASGAVVAAHTCNEQVQKALAAAYSSLSASNGATSNWLWGRVHTMQPTSNSPLATQGFSPGPYARPGGLLTVDVGNPATSPTDPRQFNFTSSGNVRFIAIMDPAAPATKMQLPGPQRDVVAGVISSAPHLLEDWVQNKYFDFAFGSQIDAVAVSAQTISPK
jgi:penicillin amidase